MKRWRRQWLVLIVSLIVALGSLLGAASAAAADAACPVTILQIQAAPEQQAGQRPDTGWQTVGLPDQWLAHWPAHRGAIWYRIDWQRDCVDAPVALGIDGISMAGSVYVNQALLWRDAALTEPMSRSWNNPRWWLLPEPTLQPGLNRVWVRVVGDAALSPGLGPLRLGAPSAVQARQASNVWRQRTVFGVALGSSAAVGGLFCVVWLLRRQEHAYGWFALMSLAWALYLATLLATDPWPFAGMDATLAMSRLNVAVFVVYALAFCEFTFRFGGQRFARLEWVLKGLAVLAVAAVCLVPRAWVGPVFTTVWLGAVALALGVCLQFQWHAWRPAEGPRQPSHMLLALCWLMFLGVGLHDLVVVLRHWSAHETWAALTSPVGVLLMALLVGARLAGGMRRVERFNDELAVSVAAARTELTDALAREHAQALRHTKLQERLRIAHDLHDGLGGALVRGMALIEQSPEPLPSTRVLSLLKLMRDDLRQVIDHGSSAGASVPDTPVQWLAPLRHRFTDILDALGVACRWQIEPAWRDGVHPSALQCLALTRVVEEALSNVIKHSGARSVSVACSQPEPRRLWLRIADDGVGFDVAAVQQAGLSVGMRSMAARAERLGGRLSVESGPGGTVVLVELALSADAGGVPAPSDWAALAPGAAPGRR